MTTRQAPEPLQFRGGWLIVARVAWIALVGMPVALFFTGLPIYFGQLRAFSGVALSGGFSEGWTAEGLRRTLAETGIPVWVFQGLIANYDLLIPAVFLTAALILFVRSGHEWIAWYTSLMLALLGLITGNSLTVHIETLSIWLEVIPTIGWLSFYIFLFIFPDGRVQPRWMGVAIVLIVLLLPLIPILLPGFVRSSPLAGPLILLLFAAGGYSQIYRYRRVSGRVERLQTRWLITSIIALGCALVLLGFAIPALLPATAQPGPPGLILRVIQLIMFPLAFMAVPAALGIAILRYKLWNIDVIIRRTLTYALITLLLGGAYYGSVALMQTGFTRLTGQDSPVTVVASTLLIAALFNPLRRRVQQFVDRRFYRRKYDLARTLDDFAASLYEEVDTERLSDSLLAVVDKTMQPRHVSLWVHDPNIEQMT